MMFCCFENFFTSGHFRFDMGDGRNLHEKVKVGHVRQNEITKGGGT